MKALIVLLMMSVWPSFYSFAEDSPVITLAADPWCPYNCNEEDEQLGYMVDVATLIFKELGYEVNYVNMPWARAISAVKSGKVDGIIGAGKDEVPELIFPAIPMGKATHTFYTLADSSWRFKDLTSLQSVTQGVIKGYSYGTLFDDYVYDNLQSPREFRMSPA